MLGTSQVLRKKKKKRKGNNIKADVLTANIMTFPIKSVHKVNQSVMNATMLRFKNIPYTFGI